MFYLTNNTLYSQCYDVTEENSDRRRTNDGQFLSDEQEV